MPLVEALPVGTECSASTRDRKSTRLNSSHEWISYAVFCLKKKRKCKQGGSGRGQLALGGFLKTHRARLVSAASHWLRQCSRKGLAQRCFWQFTRCWCTIV